MIYTFLTSLLLSAVCLPSAIFSIELEKQIVKLGRPGNVSELTDETITDLYSASQALTRQRSIATRSLSKRSVYSDSCCWNVYQRPGTVYATEAICLGYSTMSVFCATENGQILSQQPVLCDCPMEEPVCTSRINLSSRPGYFQHTPQAPNRLKWVSSEAQTDVVCLSAPERLKHDAMVQAASRTVINSIMLDRQQVGPYGSNTEVLCMLLDSKKLGVAKAGSLSITVNGMKYQNTDSKWWVHAAKIAVGDYVTCEGHNLNSKVATLVLMVAWLKKKHLG